MMAAYPIKSKTEFRILHTADWHICNEFMEVAEKCTDFLIHHLVSAKPVDLIVISGDIYNHRQIQQETESARLAFRTVKALAKFAPVVIITGTPSHDGYAPLMLDDIGDRYPVLVVDKPSQWVLYGGDGHDWSFQDINAKWIGLPNVVISCTPAFTKQHFETNLDIGATNTGIANALGAVFAGFGLENSRVQNGGIPVPHVLLGHYSISGAWIHPNQPMIGKDIEISLDHISMANPSITCLGHIHAAQKVGQSAWYSGSLFSTDFGEYEEKGFYIHTLEQTDFGHSWLPQEPEFIPTPSPVLVSLQVDLVKNTVPDDEILQAILMAATDIPEDIKFPNAVIRLEVRAYQDKADLIPETEINEYFTENNPKSFRLDIVRIPRANVRSAKILSVERLREKLIELESIIPTMPLEENAAILEKADDLETDTHEALIDHVFEKITAAKQRKENDTNEAETN